MFLLLLYAVFILTLSFSKGGPGDFKTVCVKNPTLKAVACRWRLDVGFFHLRCGLQPVAHRLFSNPLIAQTARPDGGFFMKPFVFIIFLSFLKGRR